MVLILQPSARAEVGLGLGLESIVARLAAQGIELSPPLALGLGAGLYFEYFIRPEESPSYFFIGHNRHLEREVEAHAQKFCGGDPRGAMLDALRANALAMNLDRAPTRGIMGIELVSDDFENWTSAPDWSSCAQIAASTIENSDSLYRRTYIQFLQQAAEWWSPARDLASTLSEVADEWDALAVILQAIADADSECGFSHASRMMRRLAMREEYFWGRVLEIAGS